MKVRKVMFSDWDILLKWRNDPLSRNNSHNSVLIDEKEHKEWLKRVLSESENKLFLFFKGNDPCGLVRAGFEKDKGRYLLSWVVAPEWRGRGIGKKMLRIALNRLKGKVAAEIKEDNMASIKIAENNRLMLKMAQAGVLYYVNY